MAVAEDLAGTRRAGVGLSSRQNPAYRPAGVIRFIAKSAAMTLTSGT